MIDLLKETTSESNHEDLAAVHSTVAGKHWTAAWDSWYLYIGFERSVFIVVHGASREESTEIKGTVAERVSITVAS